MHYTVPYKQLCACMHLNGIIFICSLTFSTFMCPLRKNTTRTHVYMLLYVLLLLCFFAIIKCAEMVHCTNSSSSYVPGLRHAKCNFDNFDRHRFPHGRGSWGPPGQRNRAPNLYPLERFASTRIGHVAGLDLPMSEVFLQSNTKKKKKLWSNYIHRCVCIYMFYLFACSATYMWLVCFIVIL